MIAVFRGVLRPSCAVVVAVGLAVGLVVTGCGGATTSGRAVAGPAGPTEQTTDGFVDRTTERAAEVPLYTLRDSVSSVGSNGERIAATLAGQNLPDSTGMWVGCEGTAATATYRLDGDYRRLTAVVGLQSHTPTGLTARVTVSGDGRTLTDFTTDAMGSIPIDVAVDGVAVLTVAAVRQTGTCTVSDVPYGALGNAHVTE